MIILHSPYTHSLSIIYSCLYVQIVGLGILTMFLQIHIYLKGLIYAQLQDTLFTTTQSLQQYTNSKPNDCCEFDV